MKLEDLVPPPELCKQIPEGAFADSALVWYRATISGDYVVLPRLYKNVDAARTVAPAPTLAEILEALPTSITGEKNCRFYLRLFDFRLVPKGYWQVGYAHVGLGRVILAKGQHKCSPTNPATAALELWMEVCK